MASVTRPKPGRPGAKPGRARAQARGGAARRDLVRAQPWVVLCGIGLGAVVVLGLWWQDTPSPHGLGAYLTGAGQILGLLAGYGVVILVALMARLPPLERGIGSDRMTRWHAMGGRYVVSIIVAHALLIIWGYAVTAHENVLSESATLVTQYPDVLMGTVAGFLFLGVGLVSMRAVRRRLRYETWYYLHFYTYLAIALAFSHQFANGASFIHSLAARFWWSVLYLTVAGLVLWYRVAVPARTFVRHGLRVSGVRAETPGVISVYISGERLDELAAEPGQFFRWRFLTRSLWWSSHPYSLSAAPGGDQMRITVKDRGDHSASLRELAPGTRIIAEGPYGAFTASGKAESRTNGAVLLAGGVGITPLRALFATLPGPVTLIYRASSWADVLFKDELDAIARTRGGSVHYLTGSREQVPLTSELLARLVPGLPHRDVYLCGPPGMIAAAISSLRSAGVPRRQVHIESFEF